MTDKVLAVDDYTWSLQECFMSETPYKRILCFFFPKEIILLIQISNIFDRNIELNSLKTLKNYAVSKLIV